MLLPSIFRIDVAETSENQLDPLHKRYGFRMQRTAKKCLHAQLLATTLC